MNRLLESFNPQIKVDSIIYEINTHFSAAIKTWGIIEKQKCGELNEFCNGNKQREILLFNDMMINAIYKDPKPEIFCEPCLIFISEYLNAFNDNDPNRTPSNMPEYGYLALVQDAEMMRAAFMLIGIDTRTADLTYENFLAYLPNLPENCEYRQIMSLRSQWYDHKPKGNQLKELKNQIGRIGWDKVLIKTWDSIKAKQDNDDFEAMQKQMLNKIEQCRKQNTEFDNGICCRNICLHGNPNDNRCRE